MLNRDSYFTELALCVALAVILGLFFRIPLPHLAYGGSVSLEGLPILVMALRRGARAGLAAGAGFGVVSFIVKPIVVHPIQPLLDYPVAFGVLGWGTGVWGGRGVRWNAQHARRIHRLRVAGGILLGNTLRLGAHFVSGVVFFTAYAPEGEPVWEYSLLYNASYIIPEALIQILLVEVLLRVLVSIGE